MPKTCYNHSVEQSSDIYHLFFKKGEIKYGNKEKGQQLDSIL